MLSRCLVLIFLLLGTANPAMGHKLLLIAWVQGDQLMAEAAFGTGQFAPRMQIVVADAAGGETLLTGTTDQQGYFQTTLTPDILNREAPLLVSASDGAGHLAQQIIPAEDLRPPGNQNQAEQTPMVSDPTTSDMTSQGRDQPGTSDIDPALLRELVQDAVRQEIAPLRRDILALSQAGPGIPEIIGGVGWIIGLASLGALLLRRR